MYFNLKFIGNRIFLFILILIFLLITYPFASAQLSKFSIKKIPFFNDGKILLTNAPASKRPVDVFDCQDKVYAVLQDFARKGAHELRAYWVPPSGKGYKLKSIGFSVETGPVDVIQPWILPGVFREVYFQFLTLPPERKNILGNGK